MYTKFNEENISGENTRFKKKKSMLTNIFKYMIIYLFLFIFVLIVIKVNFFLSSFDFRNYEINLPKNTVDLIRVV